MAHSVRTAAGCCAGLPSLRLALAAACLLPSLARSEAATVDREFQVKAAFLFNFAKYGEWPPESLQNLPFEFCIAQQPQLVSILLRNVTGRQLHEREIKVAELSDGLTDNCRVVYIGADAGTSLQQQIIASVREKPTLLVGDASNFLADGGAIQFHLAAGTVHFSVNLDNARAQHISISSKLLRHADTVIGKFDATDLDANDASSSDKAGAKP